MRNKPLQANFIIADLDEILGGRDPSKWDYDTDLTKLFAGMPGAIMNEELRIIPPITTIPKCTLPGSIQTLTVDGKDFTIPENTFIGLVATGVHRNPKYWPHDKDESNEAGTDLDDFVPDRWFKKDGSEPDTETQLSKVTNDGLGVDESPDTAGNLFRPAKGVYIPFSEGARACLGRRFAQVEILATLAVIFQKYSVELAVDEYASATDVSAMSDSAKKSVWNKAKAEAERKLKDEMGTIITIQLRGKPIAVRLVPRGQEIFQF
jgi:cytochrome P450